MKVIPPCNTITPVRDSSIIFCISQYNYVIPYNAAYYAQGVVDGMSQMLDNLQITYTYHIHEGTASDTANGCYTSPNYHTHLASCKKTGTSICGCGGGGYHTEYGPAGNSWPCCTSCHHYAHSGTCQQGDSYTYYACGKDTTTIYGYSLGCGKTEDTIESAIIIY